ncbi:MAG: DUF748 domain-containing protein [Burkholderiales bacterium]|nr:DUF748 domain-containing protein [Burkholderiales bacterium]
MNRFLRWAKWLLAVLILFTVLAAVGFHFAVAKLKSEVLTALGPDSEIGEINVGWHAIEVRNLRLHGPAGWPAEDALRADRVVIEPDLRSLFSGDIHVSNITVDGAYLSVWRTPAGKMRLLPSLLEKPAKPEEKQTDDQPGKPMPKVLLSAIHFTNSELLFVDASVPHGPVKLDINQMQVDITDLTLPALDDTTHLHLSGVVRGKKHDGTMAIDGNAVLATRESDIKLVLKGVDLLPLAPYLLKASDSGVKQGTLDLQIDSEVRKNHLHAPGQISLRDLELDTHAGFMGISQKAAVGLLKDKSGVITAHFTLDGNLNDPHFSINENLLNRAGAGIADTLGVSVEGLTKNVSNAAQGIGGKLRGLFH